jgi:hypothetical protein
MKPRAGPDALEREIFLYRDERKIPTSAIITAIESHYHSPNVLEIMIPRDSHHLL